MNKSTSPNNIEIIETIYKHSKDSLLREPFFEIVENEVKHLSTLCQLTPLQTVLFANAIILGYDSSNIQSIITHLGFESYKILSYKDEFKVLFEREFLRGERSRGEINPNHYKVSEYVIQKIFNNQRFEVKVKEEMGFFDKLKEFNEVIEEVSNDSLPLELLLDKIDLLRNEFQNVSIFQEINISKFSNFDLFFFLKTLWDAIEAGDNDYNTNVHETTKTFYKSTNDQYRNIRFILNGNSKLIAYNYVALSKHNFRNIVYAGLSDAVEKLVHKYEGVQLGKMEDPNEELMQHKKLAQKELFYNPEEAVEVFKLQEIIKEKSFQKLQKNFEKKGLKPAVSVLFYGDPGTGKTETAYQIAKATGRNIMKVDISATRSMWYGESQKLMKKIFTDYEAIRKEEKKCPILLFNEADAIIGKRREAGSSSLSETENAIQNILLEELENFHGILFATTNLQENLDAAFERRFLFKIQLKKPESLAASLIWKTKIPSLSEQEAQKLAEVFRFSGGEMDNIARKILMDELLFAQKPELDKIWNYCESEHWDKNKQLQKIGF